MKKEKKYARARSVSTRAGRPPIAGACAALSDWEVDEARLDNRRGVPVDALAERYGVSAKTLQRAFKRMDEKRETAC
jgi:hypothetical protein